MGNEKTQRYNFWRIAQWSDVFDIGLNQLLQILQVPGKEERRKTAVCSYGSSVRYKHPGQKIKSITVVILC